MTARGAASWQARQKLAAILKLNLGVRAHGDTALVSPISEEPSYFLADMVCGYHKPVLLFTVC